MSYSKQLDFDKSKKFIIPESAFVEDRDTWDTQDDLSAQKPENGDAYARSICQVILWTLGQYRISVNRIEEEFKMSNRRAKKIMDALEMLGIVGEQESTTPRKVLCKCYGDLSDSVLELLIRNGVPIAKIKEAFCQNSISGEEDKNAE